jgi:hypothetical protein
VGSSVSALATFLLVPGPNATMLVSYFVVFSIGGRSGRRGFSSTPPSSRQKGASPSTWAWRTCPASSPGPRPILLGRGALSLPTQASGVVAFTIPCVATASWF